MNPSSIIGLLLGAGLLIGAFLHGPNFEIFFDAPSLIMVVGLVTAWGLEAFGAAALWQAVKTVFRAPFRNGSLVADDLAPDQATMLRGMRSQLHYAGVIGSLIGWIMMGAALEDLSSFGPAWAVSMLCIFYVLLMDQFLVKPALQRLEHQIEHRSGGTNDASPTLP